MSFAKTAKAAPRVVPKFNIGCLMDISTGYPVVGLKGETITNGGFNHFTGGTGEANSAKTGKAIYDCTTVLGRYPGSSLTALDTESTLTVDRVAASCKRLCPDRVKTYIDDNGIEQYILEDITITNSTQYLGEEFFKDFKEYGKNRSKLKGDYHATPFIDPDTNQVISILKPDLVLVDSFSQLNVGAMEEMQDKVAAGDSKQNMLWMTGGKVKSQILNELPVISEKYGLYYYLTTQIGENKEMDPYAPKRSTLSYLKSNLKIKKAPDEYRYNAHNLWFNFKMKPLINQTTKAPEYPKNSDENNMKGSQDLQEIVIINLRNKGGKSGELMSIIYSQSQGVLPSLSEFHFIKTNKFGLVGGNTTYSLAIYPEVKLSRTTIRNKIEEDAKLRCAITLTSDLLQIQMEWRDKIPENLWCDAETLYEDIKKLGYDWDQLLQTRNYWTFDQYENPIPFLSAMDLLYMREGSYVPYWLEDKKK